jgi:hypothetical protein
MAMPSISAIAKKIQGSVNDAKFFSTTKKGTLLSYLS